ncbi:hypothetical protein SELMODRAFT_443457 [Selaginella moellendorffii]|uniref:non-specific serine/threonine protein kinase n=1 Tax=Selaginella moellendorffii TaxID=88036 RepID=D8S1M8_SELML|nr:chitin elicitor receptor kinase 1 [Selaginella moellendorffii]EFJ21730.1 hypothetical protein SELMODRAFT_443457 [Selaginella moellendorffii]|eukprot:XP_002977121.1 chitin elicitor receptor kinase 1 [Selaginella moellendorffii]
MGNLWIVAISIALGMVILAPGRAGAQCVPSRGCTAVAFFNFTQNEQLNTVFTTFSVNFAQLQQYNDLRSQDFVQAGQFVKIPFQCGCINGRLAHTFVFNNVSQSDSFASINTRYYHELSNVASMSVDPSLNGQLFPGQPVNVLVNCSCGDPRFPVFGLFMTYPGQRGDLVRDVATRFNTTVQNLTNYNPSLGNINSLSPDDRLFIPATLANGTYPPFSAGSDGSGSSNTGLIAGVAVGVGVVVLAAAVSLVWFFMRRSKKKKVAKYPMDMEVTSADTKHGLLHSPSVGSVPAGLSGFAVDKSVEFTYDELSAATDNFSISKKIGEGGYGAVYYGEIRDQKLAIKKMNMQATREFMSELKVLTHVHHTNLVQLIGYCTVDSLFLVYEYVDNGTLSHHLRGSAPSRLTWNQRIQIALDAARGLEYIHEHTKPTYIHRDVKSPNILIDKRLRAKVADFGLTKLTESGAGSVSLTQPTRLVGTFGYMPPEYARFGDVSPKIDVYSFGVVLYEIISAKDAIVRTVEGDDSNPDPTQRVAKGLVMMFDTALKSPDATENLKKLVDPALGTDYPFDSIWKLAKLAEACTQETPENRPNMRAVVVALMTLCSTTQELDFSTSSQSNAQLRGLVSGR